MVLQSKQHGAYKSVLLPGKLRISLTPAVLQISQITNFTLMHLSWLC